MTSSSADMAPPDQKYDVFLSFRGEDTRDKFTSHLHAALKRKKIDTYMDNRLERGDEIDPALIKAIKQSKLSVIIFSRNYASSPWCLRELVHILACREINDQFVIPVFYDIDPSHVRKQNESYAEAIANIEERFKDNMDMVDEWKTALTTAANLSGFDSQNVRPESELVEAIVNNILEKLNRILSSDLKGLVGMERNIQRIEELLCIHTEDVHFRTVGIWGMGGLGKTTLADVVYNQLSSRFEACSFLANVRENSEKVGLINLRNELLRELLKEENLSISAPSIPTYMIERLSRTKALVVLDDVDASNQLEYLLGDKVVFGSGSRVIITSRNKRILKERVKEHHLYQMKGLELVDALELFHSKAFKDGSARTDYADLSRRVVDHAQGVPLALKVLGSSFLHCNDKEDWEDEWNKLKKYPNPEIQNLLSISYNGLDHNAKGIFLDIACFFKGTDTGNAKKMLEIHGFCAQVGIAVLVDMSLISISKNNTMEMHDLLQQMGRSIVHDECIHDPGKRSRLWDAEDVYRVSRNISGTAAVEAIFLDLRETRELQLSSKTFRNMHNLRLLSCYDPTANFYSGPPFGKAKVCLPEGLESLPEELRYLRWDGYHLKSLPSEFSPHNLIELRMACSQVEKPLNSDQTLGNLKDINLSYSEHLTEIPDLSKSPNIERINLFGCTSLVQVPSFKNLRKLTDLNLVGCVNLKTLSKMPCNIRFLNLRNCKCLTEVPDLSGSPNIEEVSLIHCTSLVQLPTYFQNLHKLKSLDLAGCLNLETLSEIPCNLRYLNLYYCTKLTSIPESIFTSYGRGTLHVAWCEELFFPVRCLCSWGKLDLNYYKMVTIPDSLMARICSSSLHEIHLEGSMIKYIPASIKKISGLRILNLKYCKNLQSLPELSSSLHEIHLEGSMIKYIPPSIKEISGLRILNLKYCKNLQYLPELSSSLEEINLEGSMIKYIRASIKKISGLRILNLKNCRNLQCLPELPVRLECLTADGCRSLKTVTSSMTAVILQGDQYQYEDPYFRRDSLTYTDCLELEESAKSNIVTDAQIKIMQMASSRLVTRQHVTSSPEEDSVTMIYPGNVMPGWFSYHTEGCTINVKFPAGWFHTTNFLGLALCAVIAFNDRPGWVSYVLSCECKFKTNSGKVYQDLFKTSPMLVSLSRKESPASIDTHHVLAFFNKRNYSNEGSNNPIPFDEVTEASFYFYPPEPAELKVRKCGIRMLYTNDSGLLSLAMPTGEVTGTTDKEANNVVASDDEELVTTFWRRWARMMRRKTPWTLKKRRFQGLER